MRGQEKTRDHHRSVLFACRHRAVLGAVLGQGQAGRAFGVLGANPNSADQLPALESNKVSAENMAGAFGFGKRGGVRELCKSNGLRKLLSWFSV